MNLYVQHAATLRFIDGAAYMKLKGWCVRVGYNPAKATALSGTTGGGLTRLEAIAFAKKAATRARYTF